MFGANVQNVYDMAKEEKKKERVIAYIDGFNLYFGMLEANLEKYKWLDISSLIKSFIRPNQELVKIKYFTSRVTDDADKLQRQNTYIEALETTGIECYYGKYQENKIRCFRCNREWDDYDEKMTDVQIATQILVDTYNDRYDTAMLISGDSDLVPPIKAVHDDFTKKMIFVLFPPKRHNQSVATQARGSMIIGKKKVKDHQFDEKVVKEDGYELEKPDEWK